MSNFRKLHCLDDKIRDIGQHLVNDMFEKNLLQEHRQAVTRGNVSCVGSLAEGCTVPRVFTVNNQFPDGINREIELDIDFMLLEIPEEHKSIIQDVPAKRGIVKIQHKDSLNVLALANSIGWEVSEEDHSKYKNIAADKDGYLMPFKIKTVAKGKMELQNTDNMIELVLASALDVKRKDIKLVHEPDEVKQSAVTAEYLVKVKDNPAFTLSIDQAIIFRIDWWPDLYEEFKNRDRNWPEKIIMDDLLISCNVIAKPSEEEMENSETSEFRYSFAHLERALCMMRSRWQTFVYLVFKVLFVKHLKPLSIDVEEQVILGASAIVDSNIDHQSRQKLTSFLCKNIMLWICERFDPHDQAMWIEESFEGLTHALENLFKLMVGYFKAGYMPYYFDPEINLIANLSGELQGLVVQEAEELLSDLPQFLYFDMEREFAVCRELTKIVESISKVLEEIRDKDYIRIIRNNPELLPDIIAYFSQHSLKGKIEDEIDRINKEIRRSAGKVEDELGRLSTRVEKEVKRSTEKVEKELGRAYSRIEPEVQRSGKKVEREAKRAVKKLFHKK